jgi:DDE superfamily endonuclease
VHTLQPAYPEPAVALWATAQHRLGLKPLLRRAWSPRGQRPAVPVHHRYQWCSLYAVVPPGPGRTWGLLRPTVSIAAFVSALTAFAQAIGAGRGTQSLRVLDSAGGHVSPQGQAPAGSHLHFLPPYSPELPPAERLWPLTKAALAKRPLRD